MVNAMFAKFPKLSRTQPDLSGADGMAGPEPDGVREHLADSFGLIAHEAAGHGARSLDWHSLRAKLSAERDLRGALKGENEAMASWIRAEGSFDPRAAEALCGHANPHHPPFQDVAADVSDENFHIAQGRLPDPKPSQSITGSGCSVSADDGTSASGLSVED